MTSPVADLPSSTAGAFTKRTIYAGRPVELECLKIGGHTLAITGRALKVARIEEEWHQDVTNPEEIVEGLKQSKPKVDIFTFWQRIPDTEIKYQYPACLESLAVLPLTTYQHWWDKQVKGTTRNMVRKSQKAGVEVRVAELDDTFVQGMVEIFNESPIRQGFKFWHYGKSAEQVKREFSRFLFRETLIGAYVGNELIGFAMVANAKRFGMIGMFLGKMKHRDKATNNALLAKSVEVCIEQGLPYLNYTTWRQTSLVDFKRYNGFQEMCVPRYFVPLTAKGRLAVAGGYPRIYNGVGDALPPKLKAVLKDLKRRYYEYRYEAA
jgi:hypothetical protein